MKQDTLDDYSVDTAHVSAGDATHGTAANACLLRIRVISCVLLQLRTATRWTTWDRDQISDRCTCGGIRGCGSTA
jgi:hypothetical protein